MKNKAIVKDYNSQTQPTINAIVIYWDDKGKRKRKYFKVKTDAQKYANTLNLQIERYGKQARNINEEDTQDLILAKKYLKDYDIKFIDVVRKYIDTTNLLKPYKVNIDDAIKHFIKWNTVKTDSTTLDKAIDEYEKALISECKSKKHINTQLPRLKRFMEHFKPSCIVAMITPNNIEQWINELKKMEYVKQGDKHIRVKTKINASPTTKNNYRRSLSAFFSFCYRKDYIKDNPIKKVVSITDKKEAPRIYAVKEILEMLYCSKPLSEVRLFLVLGAFAGLRVAEIHKLTWGKIHLEEKIIEIDAQITKTSQRRIVEISDNLLEWLKPYAPNKINDNKTVISNENTFRRALEGFRKENNITWVDNGLRHSSASYHLAHSQNANLTAERMGHSVAMLKKHYMGLVRPKDAKAYWNIYPKEKTKIIKIKSKIA